MTAHPQLPINIASATTGLIDALYQAYPTCPRQVREEIVQEAWVRLLQQERPPDAPVAWLFTVGRRLTVDWWRKARRQRGPEGLEAHPGANWQERVEAHLDLQRAYAALARAPAQHRTLLDALVFEEREIEELIAAEVAARGGLPADEEAWALARDTIYKRRTRALAWLVRAIGGAP